MNRWVNGVLVPMTGDEEAALAALRAALSANPEPRMLRKSVINGRMTDPELEAWDAGLAAASARMRRMWDDAVEIDAAHPTLVSVLTGAFGAQRAQELLA